MSVKALRHILQSANLDMAGTNVATNAFVQVITAANMAKACSAIHYNNAGTQPLILATGGSGSEVASGVIIPVGTGILPVNIAKATRLSVKALVATVTTGSLTLNFLG
jgi:hypothetical protein